MNTTLSDERVQEIQTRAALVWRAKYDPFPGPGDNPLDQ